MAQPWILRLGGRQLAVLRRSSALAFRSSGGDASFVVHHRHRATNGKELSLPPIAFFRKVHTTPVLPADVMLSSSSTAINVNEKKDDDYDEAPITTTGKMMTTTTTTTASCVPPATTTPRKRILLDRRVLSQLIAMARPEWSLIGASIATLSITSSATLLMPYAAGQIIDYTILASTTAEGGDSSLLMIRPLVMSLSGLLALTAASAAGVYYRSVWLNQAGNRITARLKQRLVHAILHQDLAFFRPGGGGGPETTSSTTTTNTNTTTSTTTPNTTTTTTTSTGGARSSGDLLSVLSNDTWLVEETLTYHALNGLRGSIMTIGSLGMLIYTSPTLAVISCLTLPPVVILTKHVGKSLEEQQTLVQEQLGKSLTLAEQAIRNISTVQQSVAERYEHRRYYNATALAHTAEMKTARAQAGLEALSFCCSNAAVVAVLGYGAKLVLDGDLTAGALGGFVMYSFLLAGNVSALSSLYGDVVRALGAAKRIFDILHHVPAIRGRPSRSSSSSAAAMVLNDEDVAAAALAGVDPLVPVNVHPDAVLVSAAETSSPSGPRMAVQHKLVATRRPPLLVEFDNITFRYPSRPDAPVLRDFSLTLEPGEVVALVGGSGSGKSTVASLLTRQYDVIDPTGGGTNGGTGGMIRLDGKPVVDHDLSQLRRMIGVVAQQPDLFDGTIYDNILYGSWTDFATVSAAREAVTAAAEMAHVMEFAADLPAGLDTMVGTGTLSGGQKQRVALARAILKDSRLLIFDEATSALDAKSEEAIHRAMEQMIRGRTVLSIAHRLSTIRLATRVAVLQHGRVVQDGPFDELSKVPGPFLDLMRTQLQQRDV